MPFDDTPKEGPGGGGGGHSVQSVKFAARLNEAVRKSIAKNEQCPRCTRRALAGMLLAEVLAEEEHKDRDAMADDMSKLIAAVIHTSMAMRKLKDFMSEEGNGDETSDP